MEILFTIVFHCDVFLNLVCIIDFMFNGIVILELFRAILICK